MKVALITGAGRRRVGSFVADAFADRGHAIVVHYRTASAEAEALVAGYRNRGVEAIAVAADLTYEAEVRRLVDAAIERFGRLDAVVHCASIWQPKRLEDVTAADVRGHFEANTLSTFLIGQQAGLAMVRQEEGGAIVTLGDWAIARPYVNYAAYFPSKGAIPTLTRSLAIELGTRNPRVRVNCILPGPVMLPLDLPAQERRASIEGTLVKREGSPWNVVQAVMYLVDNDFVTGEMLHVDGGRTIYAP